MCVYDCEEMSRESEFKRLRARQVGRLMRFHREEFSVNGKVAQLTQNGLLELMSEIDPVYIGYSHTTVVRWESGTTRPTRERLEVFGRALNLSRAEVDGLIDLAGLEPRHQYYSESDMQVATNVIATHRGIPSSSVATPAGDLVVESPGFASQAIRYFLSRFAFPGVVIAGMGYFLQSVGWSADWMLTLYVSLVIGLVLAHYFLRRRRSNSPRDFLFLSLFVLLSAPLMQMHGTRMDSYGFYSLEGLESTPIPFAMALGVNLLIALAAGLIFDFMHRRFYASFSGNPYLQAAIVAFSPIVFVYAFGVVFGNNVGFWIYLLEVLAVLGGVLMALLLLQDERVKVSDRVKWLSIQLTIAIALVLTVMALMGLMVVYWDPSLQSVPDHNLMRSWENDFAALGYPASEFDDRARAGVVWAVLTALIYLVSVVGGSLLVALCRKDTGDPQDPATVAAPVPTSTRSSRSTDEPRTDVRYRPGWLAGHRILHPMRISAGMNRIDTGYPT